MDARERDARLRGAMLTSLRMAVGAAPLGGIAGEALIENANSVMLEKHQVQTAEEGARLIQEMEMAGYVSVQYRGRRPSEVLKLKHFELVKITDKGLRLWREELPPDPMVWQDRID